jgi:phospholipid/cholesterol/gamma-HCH transport system substrate-binding protein
MDNNKALETRVGLFLLSGLAVMAALILTFGQFQERWTSTYEMAVEFPNASGLIKGSIVYLAGAQVGRVISVPRPINEGRAVEVLLRIRDEARIRKDARFVVGMSGLLGDRFVDVQPQSDTADFLQDGDRVAGRRTPGIGDLTDDAKPIIDKINEIVTKINGEILTPESSADVRESIAKLKSVLTRMDNLLAQAQQGKGPLSRLLNDPKMANDLSAFISNIREHGVLFYSDDAQKRAEKERAQQRKK